ncbi:hypothetical protein PoB_002363200 [Plakobranchus ocellatus]|uniref:Uncharacterized protein n=1 Tax=Plakobranchus ocellatus TaxID=259542 RepID=A0AAV3ZPK2_9GAST|nr:hypothetical protein PoB_002363200 [Plakobranchus ocellatus]
MGDHRRTIVYTPPPTISPTIPGLGGSMRGGVLEPLGSENCLPLHAVIVKNGRIFIDGMDDHQGHENDRVKAGNESGDGASTSSVSTCDLSSSKTTSENNNYINTAQHDNIGNPDTTIATPDQECAESTKSCVKNFRMNRSMSEESEKRLEEEIERLPLDDTDRDYDAMLMDGRFSQEAFDSFMRASDAEDDHLGDIMLYNQLHGEEKGDHEKENAHGSRRSLHADGTGHIDVCADAEAEALDEGRHHLTYDLRDDQLLEYHYQLVPDDHGDKPSHFASHYHGDVPTEFNHHIADDSGISGNSDFPPPRSYSPCIQDFESYPRHLLQQGYVSPNFGTPFPEPDRYEAIPRRSGGGCRRRDSLSLEEYSTFDEDVDRLLSEEHDTSWRYVPLYPENYYRSACHKEFQSFGVVKEALQLEFGYDAL